MLRQPTCYVKNFFCKKMLTDLPARFSILSADHRREGENMREPTLQETVGLLVLAWAVIIAGAVALLHLGD